MSTAQANSVLPRLKDEIPYTVYFGTFAHTPELGVLEVNHRTAVGVDTTGTIVFIEKECKESPLEVGYKNFAPLGVSKVEIRVVDYSGAQHRFFFPGFIDTHIHAPQFPNNGIFGNTTLLEWLNVYTFPLEASFKDLGVAKEVYRRCIEKTLLCGTTTSAYYATIHNEASKLLGDTALQIGQRAFIGKVCMNQNSPDYYIETADEAKKGTIDLAKYLEAKDPVGEFVRPIITPRFAASCTADLMKWLGDFAKEHDYAIQTHLSENQKEIAWMEDLFPEADNYTDIYYKCNLLGPKTVLGHCIHLKDEERDVLVQTSSGVSHCPTSNSSITSGECRVRWLLDSGLNVGLGTDCSGGFTSSILEVARHALLVSHHLVMQTENEKEKLSAPEVLYLATMGGAKVLKIDDKVGSFSVGKRFDCQMINLMTRDSHVNVFYDQLPHWGAIEKKLSRTRFENLICKWLFEGDDRNVSRVYVNGRLIIYKD